jgi:hypothetical protein
LQQALEFLIEVFHAHDAVRDRMGIGKGGKFVIGTGLPTHGIPLVVGRCERQKPECHEADDILDRARRIAFLGNMLALLAQDQFEPRPEVRFVPDIRIKCRPVGSAADLRRDPEERLADLAGIPVSHRMTDLAPGIVA